MCVLRSINMPYSRIILALALCLAVTAGPTMANDQLKAVSDSSNLFSVNLFKRIANEHKDKNLISSLLSVDTVLSMAALGAGGNTAKEMFTSLQLPNDEDTVKQGFQSLVPQLRNVPNMTIDFANKMFVAQGLKLQDDFKGVTKTFFDSEVSQIDTTKPAEAAKAVNDWAAEKTHDRIKEIVKDTDIKPDVRLLLLNAVYFKGNWAKKFDKEGTQDRVFHVDEKNEVKVQTMFSKGDYFYGELPDLKAKFVELPYENKDFKMVIIVPDDIDGLSHIEANLESFNHTRLRKEGREREIYLYLPKFKIESTINLEQPLMDLGMADMFSDNANFSRLAHDEQLKVGKVLQKAFIEVNEEGSEAAAVTGMVMVMKMALVTVVPTELYVDRPFYYFIRTPDATLFQGHVINPKI